MLQVSSPLPILYDPKNPSRTFELAERHLCTASIVHGSSALVSRLSIRIAEYYFWKSQDSGSIIGHVAGQMIKAIYALLKRDAELLNRVPQGQEPPPPLLYDTEIHQKHRQGQYRPLKSAPPPNVITIAHLSSPQ